MIEDKTHTKQSKQYTSPTHTLELTGTNARSTLYPKHSH